MIFFLYDHHRYQDEFPREHYDICSEYVSELIERMKGVSIDALYNSVDETINIRVRRSKVSVTRCYSMVEVVEVVSNMQSEAVCVARQLGEFSFMSETHLCPVDSDFALAVVDEIEREGLCHNWRMED